MDGARAYWNGKQLVSRYGNIISCPQWFTSTLSTDIALDGELWMGYGTTNESLSRVLHANDANWSQIGYYVFDIPSSPGTYEERMREMESMRSLFPPHVHVVGNIRCLGTEHLYNQLHSIIAAGGEGVILREPNSQYIPHLTTSLLKVKVFSPNQTMELINVQKFEDTEVTVLQILESGIYCQQYFMYPPLSQVCRPNGLMCTVKCFENSLSSPPPLGSTITVKHLGAFSTGTLKNPVYWRSRQSIANSSMARYSLSCGLIL